MSHDPMAPEALALGVLPEWMSEAVWRRPVLAVRGRAMSTRARAWHLGDAPGASSPRRGPQRKAQEAINNA